MDIEKKILKAIKDNTHSYREGPDSEFNYVDGPCLTRDVLIIFKEKAELKILEINLEIDKLKEITDEDE